MKTNTDFSNAKVGDLVTSLIYGHGYIVEINDELTYSIVVQFSGDDVESFQRNGTEFCDDFAPTLLKGHIDINSLSVNYNTITPSNDQ